MADPSVGWCGRPSPCLRVQPWAASGEPGSAPAELPQLAEPDPAIERLLALCTGGSERLLEDDADASQSSSASEEILSNQDLTLDKAMIARDLLGECDLLPDGDGEPAPKRPCRAPPEPEPEPEPSAPPPPEPASEEPALLPPPPAPALFEAALLEEPMWRKPVNVGAEHQALLPPLRAPGGRRRARPTGDRLLWDPSRLAEHEVERYQRRLRPSAAAPAQEPHVRDHEQALFQLQQCGHDVEEALRRVTPGQLRPPDRLSLWSDDECDLFEQGLRLFGKDFHTIQRQKVRTRSVGEIVHFYYLWKKTERHRQFLSLTQLDKRKYGPDMSVGLSAAASSLQILMATDPWEHGAWAAGAEPTDPRLPLASLLASCPQLLLP